MALVPAAAHVACTTSSPTPVSSPASDGALDESTSEAAAPAGGAGASAAPKGLRELHVLLSSDEHGWLSPWRDRDASMWRGGAHAVWRTLHEQGFAPGKPGWLLLSAGDMWTGPYESTLLLGAPVTATMNELGYAAAAVGNHEFDFGTPVIDLRRHEARFPFLGANLVDDATGIQPVWAQAYTIVDVGGARVGILGLACAESPFTADVRNMTGLTFQPYEPALRAWLPRLQAERVDTIIVVVHDSIAAVAPLLPVLREFGVHAVAAGHQHQSGVLVDDGSTLDDPSDDIVVCNAGPYWRTLCRIDLSFDAHGALSARAVRHVAVERPLSTPQELSTPAITRIIDEASAEAERIGGEVLVATRSRLERGPNGSLGQLLVDSWLQSVPWAQVAVTNAGGLRQDIEVGPVRLRDIVSALPFNNTLFVVELTGAQLKQVLAMPESVVGGARYAWREVDGKRIVSDVVDRSGRPIADDARVKVVINDFMFRGGDHFPFSQWDNRPQETSIDWREPLYRMLRTLADRRSPLDVKADDRAHRTP